MGLNRSRSLDNSEKWLDKPKTVEFGCELTEMVGYLWKNGWINRERWDISLIQSERWDILKKRLDKPAMVGYGFESFQTVGYF